MEATTWNPFSCETSEPPLSGPRVLRRPRAFLDLSLAKPWAWGKVDVWRANGRGRSSRAQHLGPPDGELRHLSIRFTLDASADRHLSPDGWPSATAKLRAGAGVTGAPKEPQAGQATARIERLSEELEAARLEWAAFVRQVVIGLGTAGADFPPLRNRPSARRLHPLLYLLTFLLLFSGAAVLGEGIRTLEGVLGGHVAAARWHRWFGYVLLAAGV